MTTLTKSLIKEFSKANHMQSNESRNSCKRAQIWLGGPGDDNAHRVRSGYGGPHQNRWGQDDEDGRDAYVRSWYFINGSI